MVYGKITVLLLSVLWLSASFSRSNAGNLPNSEYGVEDVSDSVQGGLELFERWMEKHCKVYANPHEKAKRYAIFLSNLEYVNKRNAKMARTAGSPGFTVGLNVFSDLTNKEFKEIYTSKISQEAAEERNMLVEEVTTFIDVPSSMDWRTRGVVTQVKDQRGCESAWAFSATGAIEGINAIKTGRPPISLSEQQLVDCVKSNNHCSGGTVNNAFRWVVTNRGITSQAMYPEGTVGPCRQNKPSVAFIDGYEDVRPRDWFLRAAVARQPISVGVHASADDFQHYESGIYDGSCSGDPSHLDHAMLIVGYGRENGTDYWIVKNSWTTWWGESGYMRMRRNTRPPNGICGINLMASYPIKHFKASYPTKKSGQEAWR